MHPPGLPRILGYMTQDCKGQTMELIPSVEEFQKNLLRERSRADRSGLIFSVLTVSIQHLDDLQISVSDLVHLVVRRVRFTDYVGWFDGQNLGVLLPDTPETGGWRLAGDICLQVPATIPRLVCKVYCYPAQNPPLKEQQHPVGKDKANGSQRIETSSPGPDLSTAPAEGEGEFAGCKMGKATDRAETLWGIHPFFARRIPTWKRLLDVVGSLLALGLLSPLFALIAVVIKLVSHGPVFFRQERIGYLGKPFRFWKFRTMTVDNNTAPHKEYMSRLINNDMPMKKLDSSDDPLIIPFGIFLRKTCLDELPQLINVLMGEMSLVGPRPCLPYEAQQYLRWHARRFDSVPGMTGLWQVSGKNRTTFKEMIRLDINYERQMSLWVDLKILLKTIPTIVSMAADTQVSPPKKVSMAKPLKVAVDAIRTGAEPIEPIADGWEGLQPVGTLEVASAPLPHNGARSGIPQ
jgi:lipopolysaccharide/colanic/teichoic acid biosynthesis glycosyltransferase